jgi:hypothetical protein
MKCTEFSGIQQLQGQLRCTKCEKVFPTTELFMQHLHRTKSHEQQEPQIPDESKSVDVCLLPKSSK